MSNASTMGDYQTAQTLETFGFLPKLTQDEIYDQIAYLIANGLTPAIEHTHPSRSTDHYWTMWKLPMFGQQDIAAVAAEVDACHRSYPSDHVRVIGYDNYTQSQGVCFVAIEGRG